MIRTADEAIAELIKLGWKIPESVNVADFIRMQEEQLDLVSDLLARVMEVAKELARVNPGHSYVVLETYYQEKKG